MIINLKMCSLSSGRTILIFKHRLVNSHKKKNPAGMNETTVQYVGQTSRKQVGKVQKVWSLTIGDQLGGGPLLT